ncbi:hypothetical protein P43SY_008620 [Pythium insidiosum]|uniref:Prefoldin, alpha subunit n=1 Tax=Pythium insidiosum TaxID=114742 RepID=A0AAD5Q6K6_PYTIN|nr:hypothetical protein P43SY_008620 [Pythium insidiosum]
MATTSIDTSNPRLLQERIEQVRAQLLSLQDEIGKYADVSSVITELPKKLKHPVMVPIGKRAMMPGKIVRSNEILAHLGDEYFAWKSASDAVAVIERRSKALRKQVKAEEEALAALEAKKNDLDSIFDIKKLYEQENIKEIQETEEESERYPVTRATDEDIEEYFEVEEEERRKKEEASWDWDEMMRRMEELEAMEENTEETKAEEPTIEEIVASLKAQGNEAFGKRRFAESITHYTKAIEMDPTSHILYGNRSAAYHRLKKYSEALRDAVKATELDYTWVKGHYRKASALAYLERFQEAAEAFDRAFELCPTDAKLRQEADEMRRRHAAKFRPSSASPAAAAPSSSAQESSSFLRVSETPPPAPRPMPKTPAVSEKVFSGAIMERTRDEEEKISPPVVERAASVFAQRRSRYEDNAASAVNGGAVTLEPVGEPPSVLDKRGRSKASQYTGY